ncbi:unnamed protein product [Rotaria socialis]|uniref:Protein kinase domain-containing protein n=1 Tax=Rotaria socialis TaxID=392032 RepID=A0A819ZXZ6_9BILA|nr:unnamed protein product [Rotaria socialis]CAF3423106.1 unnamed protein product [Rotaria socialis]CAF4177414.1 unnamed protein product [Rotaria socialis]
MNKNIQKNSQNKPSKSSRKSSSNSRRSTRSTDIPSQVPHRSETHSQKSSIDLGHDLLTEIIEDLTSDIDDTRPTSTSSILSKNSQTKNNEAISTSSKKLSLSINALRNPTCVPGKKSFRSSKKGVKSSQQQEKSNSPSCFNSFDETYDLNVARKSIGEQRRDRLTKHMKEFYQDFFEFDKNSNMNSTHDNLNNNDKRKQYSTALWYELKAYFNGANSLDENGIKNEQYSIDRQRKKFLDEFYTFFSHFGFEQSYHNDIPTIQRRHMCEHHLNHCHNVEKRMQSLFLKWDYILSLFPSYAALEQYDKRFNPRTQEGRIFYEKLYIFQAWLNLHSEINHLINILGRIMSSIKCHAWPNSTCSSPGKSNDNLSRPTTPLSTSSHDQKDPIVGSPPNPSPFLTTPEIRIRRQNTFTSMSSVDSIHQSPLSSGSSLMNFYYRYIDDQVTHARIELIASIFRSKHGPLLQRLRYTYRKEHRSSFSTFDDLFKNSPFFPKKFIPNDYLSDAKPDKLIDEFFLLNKQLREQKNPKLANKPIKKTTGIYSDKVNNILNRFDQNPTLTSSTFPPAPAPTLVLKLLCYDRSILKRQPYYLDYLDPTLYPHLPGSTLFPDPCLFLDHSPLNSYSQLPTEENILIAKILSICHRLYDKHVWVDSGRFSDMCDIFHLPSLYPHYVFLVQIPLDLMIAWQKHHHDKRMEQTSTTGALLLLIDECSILIHGSTLVRQYVKLMITDTFEKAELKLIEDDLIQFDKNITDTIYEILNYIESYVELALNLSLFHNCIILLKDQWKSLKKYSTMMNIEETLGEIFLNIYAKIIAHFHEHIDIFHSSVLSSPETIKIEHIKKKIHRKYQKKLTMTILREAKAIYDDCALTINIYLQKPVCKRFLLILKTAGFERIKFASENNHNSGSNQTDKRATPVSKCLLFAPAKYFKDKSTKLQIVRILSSSFRINTSNNLSTELNDDLSTTQQQLQSPTLSQLPSIPASEISPPLVYILCVPVSIELESEWRGVTHLLPENKNLTSILPLHSNWKTTTIFLLTQQTNNLENFQESFKECLSKINVQQSDLYNFDSRPGQLLQRRSCFEKVDNAMRNLAHSILNLSNCIASNVETFEKIIEKLDTKDYVHSEERAFAFGMDVIRETSFYATQCEHNTLKIQSENQLSFANIWLNFACKKNSTRTSKYPITIPMWLLPGMHFLRHACSLHFANHIDNDLFSEFYYNMVKTIKYLNNSNNYTPNQDNRFSKTFQHSSVTKHGYDKRKKKKLQLNRIEQIDHLEKRIDKRRLDEGLIGKIIPICKSSTLSKKTEDDLAYLKIRNFHKLNLLSRGQYATTYKCTVNRSDKQEILCYKQYKIQHNNAQAIAKVLEQLIPLMHIDHENLIKYHGIALEHDHILFFMEYCSHGTIAQLLLGTSSLSISQTDMHRPSASYIDMHRLSISHADTRRTSSVLSSIIDTSFIDKDIVPASAGFSFFKEPLVQRYLRQLLSALSRLHEKEIIHRDIRNVNIFLTDSTKQSIKLGDINFVYDFKFMKKQPLLLDMEAVISKRESIVFYAPETITQNETTIKSDIWSLGCTLIHMLTGRIPWNNPTTTSSVYYFRVLNWIADGVRPPIPTDLKLSNHCIHFLEQCFQHDPTRRPSSQELLEHPFVKLE